MNERLKLQCFGELLPHRPYFGKGQLARKDYPLYPLLMPEQRGFAVERVRLRAQVQRKVRRNAF